LRIIDFRVTTDGSGNISLTNLDIAFQIWLTGSSPHSPGDRVSDFDVTTTGAAFFAPSDNNQGCATVGIASGTGVADTCTFYMTRDSSTSFASSVGGSFSGGSAPPPPATPVPSTAILGVSGLLCLGLYQWRRLVS
jgi:hypothetical protein